MHSDIFKRHGKVSSKILKAEKGAKNKAISAVMKGKKRGAEREHEKDLSGLKIFR